MALDLHTHAFVRVKVARIVALPRCDMRTMHKCTTRGPITAPLGVVGAAIINQHKDTLVASSCGPDDMLITGEICT